MVRVPGTTARVNGSNPRSSCQQIAQTYSGFNGTLDSIFYKDPNIANDIDSKNLCWPPLYDLGRGAKIKMIDCR